MSFEKILKKRFKSHELGGNIMLEEKIRQIEMEMDGYHLLLHESETPKEKVRYRGVLQGFQMALAILREQKIVDSDTCPVCGQTVLDVFSPRVRVGKFTYHIDCYEDRGKQ